MIKVMALNVNYVENLTTVRIQITEQVGKIERIKEELLIPLVGKYETIDEALMEAIFEQLDESGLNPYPEGGEVTQTQ